MKNGKKYTIISQNKHKKDKVKLKSSGLNKNCKNILILMIVEPFCYPPSYEKLSIDLNVLYSKTINRWIYLLLQ